METFLTIINSYPTSVLTTLVLILCGYWLIVAIGLLDFDFFHLDLHADIDAGSLTGFAAFLATFGLTGVPVSIVFTILIFVSWILSYTFVKFSIYLFDSSILNYTVGSGLLISAIALSFPITARVIRPLRPFFANLYGNDGTKKILGKSCRVRSLSVSQTQGEAECVIDGASLLIKIRTLNDETFNKGQVVYIADYNSDDNVYFVVNEQTFFN